MQLPVFHKFFLVGRRVWSDGAVTSAGAGKGTVAKALSTLNLAEIALADPIKRIVRTLYNVSSEDLWGPSERRTTFLRDSMGNPLIHRYKGALGSRIEVHGERVPIPTADIPATIRLAVRTIGEAARQVYRDTWVDIAVGVTEKIEAGSKMGRLTPRYLDRHGLVSVYRPTDVPLRGVLITDVRMPHEYITLTANGFSPILVERYTEGQGYADPDATEDMRWVEGVDSLDFVAKFRWGDRAYGYGETEGEDYSYSPCDRDGLIERVVRWATGF